MVKSGLFDIPLRTGHLSGRPFLIQEWAFCVRDVDGLRRDLSTNENPAPKGTGFEANRRFRLTI